MASVDTKSRGVPSNRAHAGRMVTALLVLLGQVVLVALITLQWDTARAENSPEVATIRDAGPKAKVVQVGQTVEQLNLTINQSLAIELPKPIVRAAIANDQVAAVSVVSPELVLITGKTFGFTQLILWDQDEARRVFDVRVDVDMKTLAQTLQDAAPRAQIEVRTILDSVVLTGRVPDAATGQRLLDLAKIFSSKVQNHLLVAGSQQVLLKATIAEVSRDAIRSLGFNGVFFGNDAFAGSNLAQINPTSIGLGQNTVVPIPAPTQFQLAADLAVLPTTTLFFGLPNTQMEAFITAMADNSLVRILAEPNLVAISGQTAEFLVGGEYPVPTPSQDGISITFREFGILLKFRPVVQAGQMIRLSITAEVSEPDFSNAVQIAGLVVPGLSIRNATTVIEVGSGQTFAIAGLLSDNLRGVMSKVPGLGDVPVFGALFRSLRYERSETELVILITAKLAEPMNLQQASYYPGYDLAPPTDWQLYGLGMLYDEDFVPEATSQPARPPVQPPQHLQGPWGFQQAPGMEN